METLARRRALGRPLTYRIVVPTYRRPGDLEKFLIGIESQLIRHPNVRLVVVNDGSHDDAYQAAVAPYGHLIDYRIEPENRGVQYARHAGCADAQEDILVFTDDDCRPDRHWIDWLMALVEMHPSVEMFCGATWPITQDDPGDLERFLQFTGRYPMPVGKPPRLLVAPHANFACSRELYERVGGLDMRFRVAEDWNLTQRMLRAGAVYKIASDWITRHGEGQGVGAHFRRWRHYGRGAAHQSLADGDWRPVLSNSDGTYAGVLRHTANAVRRIWQRSGATGTGLRRRLRFALWEARFSWAYQTGWRAGLRQFEREFGRARPARPALQDELRPEIRTGAVAPPEPRTP